MSIYEPIIEMKVIDLRELGRTDREWMNGFLRHFQDVYLYASVFAYCKNAYFCEAFGYLTHFWVVQTRTGACYDPYDFQQYFLYEYFNQLLHEKRMPNETEVEQKILEFFRTHMRINLYKPIITVFKIYEAERTLWIVRLPNDCFK